MAYNSSSVYGSAKYTLKLTFVANGSGGVVPSDTSNSTTSNASSVTVITKIPSTTPTRPGYKFLGYAESASGSVVTHPGYNVSRTFSRSATLDHTRTEYNAETDTYTTIYYYTCSNQSTTRTLYAKWEVAVTAPTITTQPSAKSVNVNGTASLSVTATVSSGTLSYQWQSSTNNSTWSNISGATSSSYSAPTSTAGEKYYRVIVTNTLSGNTASTTSNSVKVTVSVPSPTISKQPSNVSTFVGGTASLSVTASSSVGTLSYKWQKSTDNSTWSNISGATSNSYTASTSTAGTTYYRCVVTNTAGGGTATKNSNSVYVTATAVTTPSITKQPVSATYAIGTTATKLSVTATSNGTLSYAWSKSTNGGSTWSNISGATSSTYTPPTSSAGAIQYRVKVTATGGSQTKTATSNAATITVYEATTPVFKYNVASYSTTYYATDYMNPINGTATATGTLTYQWQRSTNGGSTWNSISGATKATYTPTSRVEGESRYRVIATATAGTSTKTATSTVAIITVISVVLTPDNKWTQYLSALKKPFVKLARLDFLNPNGSVAFSLDNNPLNKRSKSFIQSGDLSVNLQNGQRRTASVTLANLNGEYDYNVNKLWFGQQVRLWEGMILPDGEDFYISQGVFYVKDPEESFEPGLKQTTLNLVDKWAYLDGTLFGNLDGTYEVPVNSNIFNAIQSVLNLDRGNGQKVDAAVPVFTAYYNGKTTTLPDGTSAPLTNTPYTYRCDSENGTYADIILELNTMLAGWIGYDSFGQLRLSPSQDDILDQTKPIQWEFTPLNSTFLGATYSVKNSEVYNDIIVIGESLSEYGQTAGRATNYDPTSDTNANIIGLKTKRYQQSGYYTQDICESLAVFKLKRESVLKKSVSIKCSQMFHLQENNLVTIQRTDKPGAPVERHLITGFTRPIAQTGAMVVNATSVNDYPVATVTTAP